MKIKNDTERFVKRIPVNTYTEKDEFVRKRIFKAFEKSKQNKSVYVQPNIWRIIVGSRVGSLGAAFLIISSLGACFVLSRKITDLRNELVQREIVIANTDNSAIINFYLREHQDVIAQNASLNLTTPQPIQVLVNQHDILYYEIFDEQPEYMRPGIIVRGPSLQRKISLPENPAISNGYVLTLSEARETSGFTLIAPSWLDPGYRLDQVRRIEGRDTLHLLYTDGINTFSLFEQPLNGQLGLEPKDYREYALYCNKGQVGRTIFAWRDDARSYVLIGNVDMSQSVDLAQSIIAENEMRQK